MIQMVYKTVKGKTLAALQKAVQSKLDEGWQLSGSAFFGVDDTPVFVQPMFHVQNKKG
jgi:hypothetical protein